MIAPQRFEFSGGCLVTGATGLVGNNVVRQLLGRNIDVRVLVRAESPVGDKALTGLAVDCISGGLGDEAALDLALDWVSCVIHSAAFVHCGWRHGAEMREVNVEGTRRLARAARRAGARLVYVSSVDAIGLRARISDERDDDLQRALRADRGLRWRDQEGAGEARPATGGSDDE